MHVHAIVHMTWRGVVIRTWSNEKQVSWKFLHTLLSYSFTHSTCTSPDRPTIHVCTTLWTVWMKLLVSLPYMYIAHQTCTCIATIPLHVSVDCCIMFYHVSRLWGLVVFLCRSITQPKIFEWSYPVKNLWKGYQWLLIGFTCTSVCWQRGLAATFWRIVKSGYLVWSCFFFLRSNKVCEHLPNQKL